MLLLLLQERLYEIILSLQHTMVHLLDPWLRDATGSVHRHSFQLEEEAIELVISF